MGHAECASRATEAAADSDGRQPESNLPPASAAETPTDSHGEQGEEDVNQQLVLFLSNADGHIGALYLPVLDTQVQALQQAMETWQKAWETPFVWSGQTFTSEEDFKHLRDSA